MPISTMRVVTNTFNTQTYLSVYVVRTYQTALLNSPYTFDHCRPEFMCPSQLPLSYNIKIRLCKMPNHYSINCRQCSKIMLVA